MRHHCPARNLGMVAVALGLFLSPSLGWAQTDTVTAPTPSMQIRLRSLTELLNKAEYVANLFDQGETIRGIKALLFLSRLQGKGVEGIHPDRPLGAYAFFKPDVIDSSVVLLIPIANQEAFLKLLKERLNLKVDKEKEQMYKLAVPEDLPLPAIGIDHLYVRLEQDYAYVARYETDLDPKRLIPAKTFFGGDDKATISVALRLDHLSNDLKKFVLGEFEMNIEEGMRNDPPPDEVGKLLAPWFKNQLMNALQVSVLDASELRLQLDIDEKKGELIGELSVTPVADSLLAQNLRTFAKRQSLPAGIVQIATPSAVSAGIHWGLTPLARREFAQVAEQIAAEVVKKAAPEERDLVEGLFKAILPTLQAGEGDLMAALLPADRQGRHKLLAAATVQQGPAIEKYFKSIAPILSTVELADFSFDREIINGFRIHKVVINGLPERAEQVFGTSTLWLAVTERCVVVSIEENGELLRTALKQGRPVSVPLLGLHASAAELLPVLAPHLRPDEIKALQKEAFGDNPPPRRDQLSLQVTAGEKLTIRIQAHGPAIRLLWVADVFRPN